MKYLVLLVLLAVAGRAHAQKAEAEAAFDKGRKLMAAGEIDKACEQFEISMKLDPEKGTLYNLGLCHERQGKLASAWAELKELADNDTNKERQKDSARRVAALEPRLTRMKLVVKEQPGLVITRDGIDVTALVGQTPPVDPGHYTFEAAAPGKPPVKVAIDLKGEGRTVDVTIPDTPTEEPKPEPAVTDEYPTELPLRPLVLPSGMVEIGSSVGFYGNSTTTQTGIDGHLDARGALGKFEVGAGATAHLAYANDSGNPYRFAAVYGRVTYAVQPMLTGSLQYTRYQPTGGPGGDASDLTTFGENKRPVTKKIAVDVRAGFNYFQHTTSCGSSDEFSLRGEGALQFAATPGLSALIDAALDLNVGGDATKDTVGLAVGALAGYAITHQIDVYAGPYFRVAPSDGLKVFTIGVAWRNR